MYVATNGEGIFRLDVNGIPPAIIEKVVAVEEVAQPAVETAPVEEPKVEVKSEPPVEDLQPIDVIAMSSTPSSNASDGKSEIILGIIIGSVSVLVIGVVVILIVSRRKAKYN